MDLTDEDLIAQMALGQQDALRELHRRYAPYLYGLGRRMLRDQDDTENCVQDAFLNAWKAAGRFDRSLASAKTWLVTIAHRRFLQAIRDRKDASLPLEEWDAPTPARDQEDVLMAQRAVEILDDGERRLIELAYYQGHSHAELAQLTGMPLGTVKTRLRTALARMKTHLGGGERGEA
ncbi:sigma-70 family RNA polymerase sigma factor [Deinococcus sonorensis]|uniref:Sigma-70 family RNA polymerase sigma factor n=2 Tax=Deinococcus sonorensis TaxID=309891 RepID=A0AAU7UBN8_9DEIO